MRIRPSHKTGAKTMAQRHNQDLCYDALQGTGGQVVQSGLRQAQKAKAGSFPEKTHAPRAEGDQGTDYIGLFCASEV